MVYGLFKQVAFGITAMAVLVFGASAPQNAGASTLSTNYAEVFVDNLKIGGSYNLTEAANLPMWVSYGGDAPSEIVIDVAGPASGELRAGYEPIPDTSWISVSKNNVYLLPDENVNLDVTINIPNDEKYLGKKYQAYVRVFAQPPQGAKGGLVVSLALKGRILFVVAPKAPTEAELAEIRRAKARASQGVIVSPERFDVVVSSPVKKVDVTQDVPLKIINSSMEDVTVTIEATDAATSGVPLPRHYAGGEATAVAVSKKRLAMRPDSIASIQISIQHPQKEEVGKLFYVLKIGIKSRIMDVTKFVRVYVN